MKLTPLLKNKKNKKGSQLGGLIIFGIIIMAILTIGLVMSVTGVLVKMIVDKTVPGLSNIGDGTGLDIGGKVETASKPLMTMSNSLPWLVGVLYLIMLVGTLGLAFAYRVSGEKYLIILFFGIALLCIIASIFVSNIYQGFYESSSLVGDGLKDMALMSFLMLYSPVILTVITFIAGAIMFSGFEEVTV